MSKEWTGTIERIDEYRWRIPKTYKSKMRVDGIIYANEHLIGQIKKDFAPEQVANVATLPGIVKASLAMPDIHWGYGFAIGGVAATDPSEEGVVSPGGVGYDINCGVRLVRTDLKVEDIKPKLKELTLSLYHKIPAGVGSSGNIRVTSQEEKKILLRGARWAIEQGYGIEQDLECTEEKGQMQGADPGAVSERAYERGKKQSGTLGSGNHFIEVQEVEEIYDEQKAFTFGIFKGQAVVMIHSGSRGLGHQICEDYVRKLMPCLSKYNIYIPDRQLVCAPVQSPEGLEYLSAMKCAANYAWGNRQCLMHLVRITFEKFFKTGWEKLGMYLIYDIAHNIAKFEKHNIDGKEKTLCVHRKGATRAFPSGHIDVPQKYKDAGQPVIIPGDMGRNSYLLAGTIGAMENTFGSTCHGAGRCLSRAAAIKMAKGVSIAKELEQKNIYVFSSGRETLAEEAPSAYKDVNEVVDVAHNAGIAKKVARMRPLGVVKG